MQPTCLTTEADLIPPLHECLDVCLCWKQRSHCVLAGARTPPPCCWCAFEGHCVRDLSSRVSKTAARRVGGCVWGGFMPKPGRPAARGTCPSPPTLLQPAPWPMSLWWLVVPSKRAPGTWPPPSSSFSLFQWGLVMKFPFRTKFSSSEDMNTVNLIKNKCWESAVTVFSSPFGPF